MSQRSPYFCSLILALFLSSTVDAQNLIYFEKDSDELLEKSINQLDSLAIQLLSNAQYGELKIIGHTDNDGSILYNKELSLSRSMAVMDYLRSKKLVNRFHIISKGEIAPINNNSNSIEKSKNRRVEIQSTVTDSNLSIAKKEIQTFSILPLNDTLITGEQGTKISFSKSIFKDVDTTRNIDISLQEFYKKSSFVANRLTTLTTSNKVLESRGMIHLTAQQDGEELELKEGSSYEVLFAERRKDDQTEIFYGADRGGDVIWNYIESIQWRSERILSMAAYKVVTSYSYKTDALGNSISTTDTIFYSGQSRSKEEQYSNKISSDLFQKSTKLGWINCDRFWKDNSPKKDIFVQIEEDFQPSLSLVFKNINAVLPYSYKKDDIYVFKNIPVNQDMEIVGIFKAEDDQKIYYARMVCNTLNEDVLKLDFQETTLQEVRLHMESL